MMEDPTTATERAVIISDLHVGAGPLDDCDHELDALLTSFIEEIARQDHVELIIAGDFLDFVQAPPWEGNQLEA
jgi:UDP-2,3-diacylglucosamine pyrophosphatase LpxH